MPLNNTPNSYIFLSKTFHWSFIFTCPLPCMLHVPPILLWGRVRLCRHFRQHLSLTCDEPQSINSLRTSPCRVSYRFSRRWVSEWYWESYILEYEDAMSLRNLGKRLRMVMSHRTRTETATCSTPVRILRKSSSPKTALYRWTSSLMHWQGIFPSSP